MRDIIVLNQTEMGKKCHSSYAGHGDDSKRPNIHETATDGGFGTWIRSFIAEQTLTLVVVTIVGRFC